MAKKTNDRKSLGPIWVAVCCLAAVGGLGYYIANSPGRTVPQTTVAPQSNDRVPRDVKVYTPTYNKGELNLQPSPAKSPEKADPCVFAVNDYLSRLSMVPKAARLMTSQINGDTATLDFSQEFETTYGTEDEQTVVKGILTTMAQFPGVKFVKFTIQGRTLDSLGNIDLTGPQPVLQESSTPSPPGSSAKPG